MTRREKREEIRQIKRELARLQNNPIYLNILQDEYFAEIVKKNELALADGTADSSIQFKYGKAIDFLAKVNQLQERLKLLIQIQNVPYVKNK